MMDGGCDDDDDGNDDDDRPARDEGSKGMCSPASSDAIPFKHFLPHQRDDLIMIMIMMVAMTMMMQTQSSFLCIIWEVFAATYLNVVRHLHWAFQMHQCNIIGLRGLHD